MANIDRIVNVLILLRTAGVAQQNFSDLMLLGPVTTANRVSVVTSADALLTGFGLIATSPMYKAAQVYFSQIPRQPRLYIGRQGGGEAADVALAACAAENNAWYGVAQPAHVLADIPLIAAWVESASKLFFTVYSEAGVITAGTTDAAAAMKTANYFRTAGWYHSDATQFPEVAAAARGFSTLPGGETWANMRIAGVTSTNLSETQYTFALSKNVNTFEPFRDIAITQNGKVAAGEWIDVIRFRDWLAEEIKVRTFLKFVDNRIPYTDEGIAVIRQAMIGALELGVKRRGIAPPIIDPDNPMKVIPPYITSVPTRASVSQNNVANRILTDVNFTARLAGAIHAVTINGVLQYENLPSA